MKKHITLFLAIVLLLSMTACGRKMPEATDGTGDTAETPQATAKHLQGTMEDNLTKIMQAYPVEFMGGLIPVDLEDTSEDGLWTLKSFTGLDSSEKLTDIAVYEPMTGSQAFSLVLVRLKSASDAKTVAQQMKDNINPGKWICVRADQVLAAGYMDTVLFVMLDSALGVSAQGYVDAYANLCGGKVDFTI